VLTDCSRDSIKQGKQKSVEHSNRKRLREDGGIRIDDGQGGGGGGKGEEGMGRNVQENAGKHRGNRRVRKIKKRERGEKFAL